MIEYKKNCYLPDIVMLCNCNTSTSNSVVSLHSTSGEGLLIVLGSALEPPDIKGLWPTLVTLELWFVLEPFLLYGMFKAPVMKGLWPTFS